MKLEFKYTNELVSYLLNIERYKTALEYLYLPTRTKQKLLYDAKLKKTHFSTSIEGNVLSLKQVENVINQKNQSNKLSAEVEVQNYWDALSFLEEEKTKLEKERADFETFMSSQKESIALEKKRIEEYEKAQKIRLENEQAAFNEEVTGTRKDLNLEALLLQGFCLLYTMIKLNVQNIFHQNGVMSNL